MRRLFVGVAIAIAWTTCAGGAEPPAAADATPGSVREASRAPKLPGFEARGGRVRPLVAVVGDNAYTELTDYVVPYGVLAASGAADVVAVATGPGPIRMFPTLHVEPQATIAEFDARHPAGADYVIVPAVHDAQAPALLGWVVAQRDKGAAIVGVCDGAWVLAHAGLLDGRAATVHWYSFDRIRDDFPDARWTRDARYVVDGDVVTTTGVTASIPVSLALVEVIAGRARASALAASLGLSDWSPRHHSADFALGAGDVFIAARNWLARWSHEEIGIRVAPGVDEIALALQADALSRTYRSRAVIVAAREEVVSDAGAFDTAGADPAPVDARAADADTSDPRSGNVVPTDVVVVTTRRGLRVLADTTEAAASGLDRLVEPRGQLLPARALDETLADIERWYGRRTADFVALQMEHSR